MADRRLPFRFRLPWLSAATPRAAAKPQPPRPTVQPQIPSQPATTAQHPPFRPPGISPAQPLPSQVQAPPRPQPQTAPPLPAAIGSPTTSQPVSVSRSHETTQTRTADVPSPSHMAPQPLHLKSPSRSQPQRVDQAFSQPTSPGEPTQAVPHTLSPSKKSESTTQDTSQAQPISTELPSSATKEERKPEAYLPLLQEPEPKTQPASKTPSKHQTDSPVEIILQQRGKAGQAGEAPIPGTLITPNSGAAPKQRAIPLTKAEEKLEETAETEKSVEESQEKKKTITTSPSDGKVVKTVDGTQPKDRGTYHESLQKHSLSDGERAPLQKEIKEDISKLVQALAIAQSKQRPMDEKPISGITLAGENKGASMYIGSHTEKKVDIRRGYKTNQDDSSDATTDGEGRSMEKHRDPKTKEEMATKAYVNRNIEGIINSLMFDSNVNQRNPGVHLAFSRNFAEPSKYSSKLESLETSKAEYSITPAEKLTYAPIVRRPCLGGLFMESSDSEPDNPDKLMKRLESSEYEDQLISAYP